MPTRSQVAHRDRRLRPGEGEKLIAYFQTAKRSTRNQLVQDSIDFVLSLGFRRGTLRRLQFADFRWDEGKHGMFDVPPSKMKGKRRSIKAATLLVRRILERRRETFMALGVYGPDCHIFGKTTAQGHKGQSGCFGAAYGENDFLIRPWQLVLKGADLPYGRKAPDALHFHDLRAEAACRLYENGGRDVLRVMRFLDHRSLQETQVYLDRLTGDVAGENAIIMAALEADRTAAQTLGIATLPTSEFAYTAHAKR